MANWKHPTKNNVEVNDPVSEPNNPNTDFIVEDVEIELDGKTQVSLLFVVSSVTTSEAVLKNVFSWVFRSVMNAELSQN